MRFLLSLTHEDNTMATRQQPERKAKNKENTNESTTEIIVKPTDSTNEADRLASGANNWGENELKLLRVTYPLNRSMNLETVLQVDESQWSDDMRRRIISCPDEANSLGVAEGVRQIGAVDMDALYRGVIDIDYVEEYLAPKFAFMFTSLLSVMRAQETKELERQKKEAKASQTSTTTGGSPKTPDQPTFPVDSDLSGGTTQSKDEESTKFLLDHLVKSTMGVLRGDFRKITWSRSHCRIEIFKRYTPMILCANNQ